MLSSSEARTLKQGKLMHLRAGMSIGQLAREMREAGVLGAGKIGEAVDIMADMFRDPDYTVYILNST